MTMVNISLPDAMRDWVDTRVGGGAYADDSDYVRDLIRRDQEAKADLAPLQSAIERGRASGVSARSVEDIITAERARVG